MKQMPDNSIDCVVTSPPYYRIRNYEVDGQLGMEDTPDEYVDKLIKIFLEVKRILKPRGTLFVNIDDTYGGSGNGSWNTEKEKRGKQYLKKAKGNDNYLAPPAKTGKYAKSLLCIPFKFAIAMVENGWILRNTIIWEKSNAIPESVKDRFTVDFEYLFFFTKNKKYYFEQQLEPIAESTIKRANYGFEGKKGKDGIYSGLTNEGMQKAINDCVAKGMRNKRCVWNIATRSFHGEHFAVFPTSLIETPIKAGCPKDGIVLDPFMGSGTVGEVAIALGRNFVGIELNEKYCEIARERIGLFAKH